MNAFVQNDAFETQLGFSHPLSNSLTNVGIIGDFYEDDYNDDFDDADFDYDDDYNDDF